MGQSKRYSPMKDDRIGLIDGDIILYACGYVSDKEEVDEAGAFDITDTMLLNIRHTLDLTCCRLFFSDTASNNFRYKVATTHGYKAGRSAREKPTHYQAIKDYMLSATWGGEVTKDAEADDGMGKAQKKNTIICTIDKDLMMIPGWHYNWNKYTIFNVSIWDARKHFWTQMLTGDSVDNIKGIHRVGPKKAEKVFEGVDSEIGLYAKVVAAYCEEFGDDARSRYQENYDLLMIRGAPVNFRDEAPYETGKEQLASNWAGGFA